MFFPLMHQPSGNHHFSLYMTIWGANLSAGAGLKAPWLQGILLEVVHGHEPLLLFGRFNRVYECLDGLEPCTTQFVSTVSSGFGLSFFPFKDGSQGINKPKHQGLQVICRNAEALGGGLAGILGTFLYTINPVAPFVFTTGMACCSDDIRIH